MDLVVLLDLGVLLDAPARFDAAFCGLANAVRAAVGALRFFGAAGLGLSVAIAALYSVLSSQREPDPVTSPYDTQIFAARLTPHRSLQKRQFHLLLMIFSATVFFITIPFVLMGAWPVAGFMGADIALFYWAFRANFRDARTYEDIRVTPLELSILRVNPQGGRKEWRFNPAWVRIEREEDEDYGLTRLAITVRGRGVELGAFLGPEARAKFAGDLAAALAAARRGPDFPVPKQG